MQFLLLTGFSISIAKEEIKMVELLSHRWPSEFTKPQYDLTEPCPVYQFAHVQVNELRISGFYSVDCLAETIRGEIYFPGFDSIPDGPHVRFNLRSDKYVKKLF